jgi:ADP-ribosylglycohydrolase
MIMQAASFKEKTAPGQGAALPSIETFLFDHFNDAMGSGVNQYSAIVHNSVPIFAGAMIFLRNVIVGNAALGQDSADANIFVIVVRRVVTFGHIAAKTRTLIHAQNTVDAADHTANNAPHHGSHRSSSAISFARTALDSAGHTLRRRCDRHE